MTVKEFLKETYKPEKYTNLLEVRPHVICADGFRVSIQAGYGLYSMPRNNLENGEYEAVELGFPSEPDELIKEYAECEDYTMTVYGYVPIEVVEQLIEKHGGIKELRR